MFPWILKLLRWIVGIAATIIFTLVLLFTLGGYIFSGPRYSGPVSDHFDGDRFHNPNGALASKGFREMIRWQFNRKVGPWRDWVESTPGSPPPKHVAAGNMRVTFVNHATLLVQMDGINVLTDPIWSERASPLSWLGPRRVHAPGIRFEDLPKIDAVVISHNHYDHTDLPTLKRLQQTHDPLFFCHLGNKALLESIGIKRIVEMDWWDAYDVGKSVKVHSVPAQHFSARGTFDRNRTLWGGYVLSGPAGNLFFAGDTGMGPHFDEIRRHFRQIQGCIL